MHQLDVYLFHAVNGWAGNWALDRLVGFEESSLLFRGGLMLIPCWWFWFAGEGERRAANRRIVIATLLGTFAALVLARGLATTLPYRLRPMNEAGIGFRSPSFEIVSTLENWSSFPSDTAALFFALSFGALRLSRPLGAALIAYSAIWICLPRIYLGVHYPSDIAVGAAIGLGVAWATGAAMEARGARLGRGIMARVDAFEARWPQAFYAGAFALSFEMATMFDDVRAVGRLVARNLGDLGLGRTALFLVMAAVVLALALACWVGVLLGRRPRRTARRPLGVPVPRP